MDNRDQSEFNMAVSYLNRLNVLFYLCDESSMELNVTNWTYSLRALFRELSTEMKPEEIKKFKDKFKKINTMKTYHDKMVSRGKNDIKPELYTALEDVEIDIRKILKDSGMLLKMKKDAGSALEDFN